MKARILLAAVALFLAVPGFAQSDGDIRNLTLATPGTGSGLTYVSDNGGLDMGAQLSAGLDWSIIPKRLSISLDEEIRLKDNFSNPGKAYSNVSLSLKLFPWLKAGAYYSFIMAKNSAGEWRARHRGAASLTASAKVWNLKISLREKFQATYKDYEVNPYQSPQTEFSLKSRLKVEYDLLHSTWTPYVSAEVRNCFNAVNPSSFVYGTYTWQKYDGASASWENKTRTCYGNLTPTYDDIYVNRLRFNLGVDWKFARNQSLDMFLIFDYFMDMPIDFTSSGIQKSYGKYLEDASGSVVSESNYYKYGVGILTLKDSFFFGVGLAYRFKI